MAAFDPIEFAGISPSREVPIPRQNRSASNSSTSSSISLESGSIDHRILLSSPTMLSQPSLSSSFILMTLEPEDMVYDLERSAFTQSIVVQRDAPTPLDRFTTTHERHERLALALQAVRKTRPTHRRHPPHEYTKPNFTNNININRYLTDTANQRHELLAYMLEQHQASSNNQQPEQPESVKSLGSSSIALSDVNMSPDTDTDTNNDDNATKKRNPDQELEELKKTLAEMKRRRNGEGRARVYKAPLARKRKPE
ncbi:hypothetical protein QBC43DRAFT_358215 [Cladorrhinum sp. PSN259]|nr:hypothetical protein QBC43DRAFT_358215 [Cladorrhinum sp. PSN259]